MTLKALKEDGIITVPSKTIEHSCAGDFVTPSKPYPKGRLDNGGHTQAAIDDIISKGFTVNIEKTFGNGVRIGGVENHKNAKKAKGTVGQSWFPESWTDDDILEAATYIANNSELKPNGVIYADYKGVRIGMFADKDGNVSTIFPDGGQQYSSDGKKVEVYGE